MKKRFQRASAFTLVVLLLVTLVIPMTGFACVDPGPCCDTQYTLTLYYEDEAGNTLADPELGKGYENTTGSFNAKNLLGKGYELKDIADRTYSYHFTANGTHTFVYVKVQSKLTVEYRAWSPGAPSVHGSDSYTQEFGTQLTVNKLDLLGYELKPGESSSYTHTFGLCDRTYVFWYVPVAHSKLTVHYYIVGTTTEVKPDATYERNAGTDLTVTANDTSHYTVQAPDSYTHHFTGSDSEYAFFYLPKQYELTVEHVVQGSSPKKVLDTESYTQDYGTSLEVSKKTYQHYEFASGQEGSVNYTFDQASGTVTFYYVPNQYDLIVKHVVQGSDPEMVLETEPTYTQAYGTQKTVASKTFSDYTRAPGQEESVNYTFDQDSGTVTFYYVLKQSTLTVQYLLDGSGDPATELHADSTYTQNVGTSLSVSALSIDGYTLKAGEATSYTHDFTNTGYIYTFWYVEEEQPTPQSTLTVCYKLQGSGTQLHSPSAYTRDVGVELTVDAYSISGYKLANDQDSSYTHTFGESDDTYTFWYVKRESPPPAAEYSTLTVSYKLAGSSPAVYLESDDTITKKVGSSVTVDAPSIDGYVLKEGQAGSYTHTFGSSDSSYVFLYEEEATVPEEEPPLAEVVEEEPPVVEVVEEVPQNDVPLSELPATGGLPMELFYGFGSMLLVAGVVTGRKNKK